MAYLTESPALNECQPMVMHIDLNSAFASIEQQANPLLRGKPIGVCSYVTPGGIVLAASYEAKKYGIGTGTVIREAKQICPEMIFLMPDPDKYFYVNACLYALLYQYTNDIAPLSIDEFAIDFTSSRKINARPLIQVAREIKYRIKREIGNWMRVNIGIAPNRFLAKQAASLHKPNGLDVISHRNLREVYAGLSLRDLFGISYKNEARLNTNGIFTPLEFLDASVEHLHKQVFRSIEGYRWHQRLRGYEVDGVTYGRKTYGNDFAIYRATDDHRTLSSYFMKLSEKTGRRLRRDGSYARGAKLWLLYEGGGYWHKGEMTKNILYSTQDIYAAIQRIYNKRPHHLPIAKLGISVYALGKTHPEQLELFVTKVTKQRRIATALDALNDKYGEFTITPGTMMAMDDTIIKRVPFGATKDLKDQYQQLVREYGLS